MRLRSALLVSAGLVTALLGSDSFGQSPPDLPGVQFQVGVYPSDVAVGDLNADGIPDLVVTDRGSDSVSVLLAQSPGEFGQSIAVPVGGPSFSAAIADLNGDDLPDAVVASPYLAGLRRLVNQGSGVLEPASALIPYNGNATCVRAADLNSDRTIDLVVCSGPMQVLFGDGRGGFGAAEYPGGIIAGASVVTVQDINGDGQVDLIGGSNSDSITVLLGDGLGGFSSGPDLHTAGFIDTVAVGDLNLDGVNDLAAASVYGPTYSSNGPGVVSVFLGMGGATFAAPVSTLVPFHPVDIEVADFTGDGRPDVALPDSGGLGPNGYYAAAAVAVMPTNDQGQLGTPVLVPAGAAPSAIASADLDADGQRDIVVSNVTDTVTICRQAPAGGFPASLSLNAGNKPWGLAVGDLDGDDDPDIVAGNTWSTDLTIYLCDGNGGFAGPGSILACYRPSDIAIGRLDQGPVPDIASTCDITGDVMVYFGNGAGGVASSKLVHVASRANALALADFNGDSTDDIAVAAIDQGAFLLLADGHGGFGPAVPYYQGPYQVAMDVASADLDQDGAQDLVIVDGGKVLVLYGDGLGQLGAPAQFSAGGSSPTAAIIADFNADGWPDVATAGDGGSSVLMGIGAGALAPATDLIGPHQLRSISAADLNGDGFVDLAVASYTNSHVSTFVNDGTGQFSIAKSFATDCGPLSIAAGDFDRNGMDDVVTTNNDPGNLTVLLAAPTFAPPTGLAPYGDGTPGCFGPQHVGWKGPPAIGNKKFTLTCSSCPTDGLGFLVIGNSPDPSCSGLAGKGINLCIGSQSSIFLMLSIVANWAGTAKLTAPIPDMPAIVGQTIYVQYLWFWATCAPSPWHISSSDGLAITFQSR